MLKTTNDREVKMGSGKMAKRITFIALILISLAGLWGCVLVYRQAFVMLQTRGLEGPANLILFALGIAVLLMPVHLRMTWEQWSAFGMVREYVVRFSMVVGVLFAFFFVLALIVLIITLPARVGSKYLLVPWLIFIAPMLWVVVDMVQRTMKPSLQNFAFGYALYAFRIYFLLLVQFMTIPVAFVLFPAGFLFQFLSVYDLAVRWGFHMPSGERPLLCTLFNLGQTSCIPGVITLHIGHLVLALAAVKFGPILFKQASNIYHNTTAIIASRLE